MSTTRGKSFSDPDELTEFPNGVNAVITLGDLTLTKGTFMPGWRWSHDIQPIVQTKSCESHHRGYIISGRIGVRMDDGTEAEYGPDTVINTEPGHEGWVIGDEPVVMLEIGGDEYGKPSEA
jgi:hypothetical protein